MTQHIENITDYQAILTDENGIATLWIEDKTLNDSDCWSNIPDAAQADEMILEWMNDIDPAGTDIRKENCTLNIEYVAGRWRFGGCTIGCR